MRFQQVLKHGLIGSSVFFLVILSIIALPVSAQMDSSWDASETGAPLSLVWQTAFTPDTALTAPGDIAIDSQGNVYVSTQSANTVKKFDRDGNYLMEWGGGGKGDGNFSLSLGIGVDSQDNIYVTDFYHLRIQKFASDGTFLKQWPTELSTSPAFLAVDAWDNVYIDQFPPHDEHYILKYDSEGNQLAEWGEDSGDFNGRVEDIAVDLDGNLYVVDILQHRVQKLSPDGELLASFGGESSKEGNGQFEAPFGVAVDGEGYIYVLDGHFLQKLDWDGNFITQWSTAPDTDLEEASNVAVDAEGYIYVFARGDVTTPNGTQMRVPVLKKFQQDEG